MMTGQVMTSALNQLVPGTLRSPEAEDDHDERRAASDVTSEVPSAPIAKGAGVTTRDQPRHGRTVVLRRQLVGAMTDAG